mmetsp:Transcript_21147/g.51753  ORF Transcript_21147/g.51753 Transcript_21147/m.51753 type:complete len:272 (+) Transcript_21147:29-844(+)
MFYGSRRRRSVCQDKICYYTMTLRFYSLHLVVFSPLSNAAFCSMSLLVLLFPPLFPDEIVVMGKKDSIFTASPALALPTMSAGVLLSYGPKMLRSISPSSGSNIATQVPFFALTNGYSSRITFETLWPLTSALKLEPNLKPKRFRSGWTNVVTIVPEALILSTLPVATRFRELFAAFPSKSSPGSNSAVDSLSLVGMVPSKFRAVINVPNLIQRHRLFTARYLSSWLVQLCPARATVQIAGSGVSSEIRVLSSRHFCTYFCIGPSSLSLVR